MPISVVWSNRFKKLRCVCDRCYRNSILIVIQESVELPLTHPELYEEMGIKPPKGVILYGVPGTGKTLLAKAVANQTSATFLRVVGSELIQKYLGDGPKLVRELFRVAEEHAPSIVFIDEIDAIGTKRWV
jgi:26S proteasome regulatory subunit T2